MVERGQPSFECKLLHQMRVFCFDNPEKRVFKRGVILTKHVLNLGFLQQGSEVGLRKLNLRFGGSPIIHRTSFTGMTSVYSIKCHENSLFEIGGRQSGGRGAETNWESAPFHGMASFFHFRQGLLIPL